MGTMFSDDAMLNGLLNENDTKGLAVSKVIHKAFIEIDENGSEAGGSSGKSFKMYFFLLLYVTKYEL